MNLSNAWRPSGRRGKISSMETSSDRPQRAGSEFDQVLTNPQRNWTRRLRLGAGVAALGAVLAACSSDDQVFNTLDPKGENARQIDGLTMGIGWMATIVGIIVAALVVYVIIKFRATEETYDDLPEQVHGNTPAELGWTIAPAVLLLGVSDHVIKKNWIEGNDFYGVGMLGWCTAVSFDPTRNCEASSA